MSQTATALYRRNYRKLAHGDFGQEWVVIIRAGSLVQHFALGHVDEIDDPVAVVRQRFGGNTDTSATAIAK